MRNWLLMLSGALMGAALAHTLSACKRDKTDCADVRCDYTHVTLSVVDAEGDESYATKLTYTFWPYGKGSTKMSEDEAEDAGYDLEENRKAHCLSEDDEECALWVADAGFGEYVFTGVLAGDDEEDPTYTVTCKVSIPIPASSENEDCCGLVATEETDLLLDPDGDLPSDTADTASASAADTGATDAIPDCDDLI